MKATGFPKLKGDQLRYMPTGRITARQHWRRDFTSYWAARCRGMAIGIDDDWQHPTKEAALAYGEKCRASWQAQLEKEEREKSMNAISQAEALMVETAVLQAKTALQTADQLRTLADSFAEMASQTLDRTAGAIARYHVGQRFAHIGMDGASFVITRIVGRLVGNKLEVDYEFSWVGRAGDILKKEPFWYEEKDVPTYFVSR